MLVYKFGGASVASAEGVKRVFEIINQNPNKMIIIVSAMGKTTNKLEKILDKVIENNFNEAIELYSELEQFHLEIIKQLDLNIIFIKHIFEDILEYIELNKYAGKEYEYRYDSFISYGEILSSAILSMYLDQNKMPNKLLNMRDIMITDSSFKEANVDMAKTTERINRAIGLGFNTYVTQGFIGGDEEGNATTLGREGSDYSAAVIANCINSNSVTIWKDVDGIYSADPKEFENAVLMPQLQYSYAAELAFSGAQIIHYKTISPLENKNIPLFVKPFNKSESNGTVINGEATIIKMPVLIVKKNQSLVSICPKNLMLAIENCIEDVMHIFNTYKQKINLIQISAVTISISTENSRHFNELIESLQKEYTVSFNTNLEILTIRNYTEEILNETRKNKITFIEQRTRKSIKILQEA